MNYKPSRDIPKAVRELKTLSPSEIREWIRNHRTRKDARGKRVQHDITAEAITMWFKRNPKVYESLKAEIEDEQLSKTVISETLFDNGAFRKIPCIEKWIMKLRARPASERAITQFVNAIKRICKGRLPHGDLIEEWGLKHPRALTLEDAMKYNSEVVKRGFKGRSYRLALRNFLKSRNIEGWDEISGKLETQAGKYAHLYTTKMDEVFAWLKDINEEAWASARFGYKTACRTGATLNADAKYVSMEDHTIKVFEKASLNRPKRIQEKLIPEDLWDELLPRIERGGRLFHITPSELNGLLRACYKQVIPELADEIPMPFHFFRHQFAQHMLRATNWNYGLVARLGHWTVETLERYYGKMDRATVMEAGRKHLPTI